MHMGYIKVVLSVPQAKMRKQLHHVINEWGVNILEIISLSFVGKRVKYVMKVNFYAFH